MNLIQKCRLPMSFLAAILCLVGWTGGLRSQAAVDRAPVTEMYDILVGYRADLASLQRYYSIPFSPGRRERLYAFFRGHLEDLRKLPFDTYSTGGRVDYLLFRQELEDKLWELREEQESFQRTETWTAPGQPLYPLEAARLRGQTPDGQAVAASLDAMTTQYRDLLRNWPSARLLAPADARQASATIRGQQRALRSVYGFYADYDPSFTWWTKRTVSDLDTLLSQYAKFLLTRQDSSRMQPDDGSGIFGVPIGAAELERQLRAAMIPYSADELLQIAGREFAWCDREMLKASRELGFGTDWKKALEQVKRSYVPPGEQPEAMMALYQESVDFLKQHDLLTIPPIAEETWRMQMIEPERQRISPFFLGGEVLQISYPTDAMTYDEKMMSMRGNNPHFSRATVHHELIAGHHLQGFMYQRAKPYRFFHTPFWTEGWSLYWEMLLWDLGFARSPEDKVGMLFWRMHRCARILFSIHYHREEWTPQQCIDFLVDRVGHERANAEGEVRRSVEGGYGPLYQLAYMIGGLQFRALKDELVGSGKMTYKEFHDAVLRENNIPVEMVRAILTNQALSRDFKTHWRFYPLP